MPQQVYVSIHARSKPVQHKIEAPMKPIPGTPRSRFALVALLIVIAAVLASQPAPREHPTDQNLPILRWTVVCGACHDSTDAQAHIHVQTDGAGNESCGVCHGPNKDKDVERVHKTY